MKEYCECLDKIKEAVGEDRYEKISSFLYYREGYIYLIVKNESPYQICRVEDGYLTTGIDVVVDKYITAIKKEGGN